MSKKHHLAGSSTASPPMFAASINKNSLDERGPLYFERGVQTG